MSLQAIVDLFEIYGFKVALHNADRHMVLDHKSGSLQISYYPTTGRWLAWGRSWGGSTPEQIIEAFSLGRFRIPDEIRKTETRCKRCHATIWWAKTTAGKKMPVNRNGAIHMPNCKATQEAQGG